jgi:hypothetical protein
VDRLSGWAVEPRDVVLGGPAPLASPTNANARRFQQSAQRLALPESPVDEFMTATDVLIEQDRARVPSGGERSLYL